MKILLVNSHNSSDEISENIIQFFDANKGVWELELGAPEILEIDDSSTMQSWDNLFNRLKNYRAIHNIEPDTFILLLTEDRNNQNWFGMFDTSGLNQGFLQTSYWDELVSSESIYPILYEVIAIPLQWRMFSKNMTLEGNVHERPIGCINDFCEYKSDIILKLQTGNICSSCYDKMLAVGMSENEIDYIDLMLDKIRLNFRIFNQNRKKRVPAKLSLKKDHFYIGSEKLSLTPVQKAIYLLFQKERDGIMTSYFIDYEDQLKELYGRFYKGSRRDEIVEIALKLARNEDDMTTQAVSKINSKIKKLVIKELADHYKIITDADGYKTVEAVMENE